MISIRGIYKDMLKYGKEASSLRLTPSELTNTLRWFLGNSDVKFKTQRDPHLSRNQVVVTGNYDPVEDGSDFSSITIYVLYDPNQKIIYIRDIDWTQLCIDAIECIGHEMVHQNQYRERGYESCESFFVSLSKDEEKRNDQEYLGNMDEVEAFGYSIAAEIYLKKNPDVIEHRQIIKTRMYKEYEAAFGADHPVVTKLLEFVRKYYVILQGEIDVKEPELVIE